MNARPWHRDGLRTGVEILGVMMVRGLTEHLITQSRNQALQLDDLLPLWDNQTLHLGRRQVVKSIGRRLRAAMILISLLSQQRAVL